MSHLSCHLVFARYRFSDTGEFGGVQSFPSFYLLTEMSIY